MRILCNDENLLSVEMMDTLEKAAALCVQNEKLDAGNVEISLTFVSKEEIRDLNRTYRDIDKPTDVLSFPLIEDFDEIDPEEDIMLGDVVICLDKAEEQAKEYGHSREREIVYLFVHSICHLLGYDHMTYEDKVDMRQAEETVMGSLNLERKQ